MWLVKQKIADRDNSVGALRTQLTQKFIDSRLFELILVPAQLLQITDQIACIAPFHPCARFPGKFGHMLIGRCRRRGRGNRFNLLASASPAGIGRFWGYGSVVDRRARFIGRAAGREHTEAKNAQPPTGMLQLRTSLTGRPVTSRVSGENQTYGSPKGTAVPSAASSRTSQGRGALH